MRRRLFLMSVQMGPHFAEGNAGHPRDKLIDPEARAAR